MAMEKILLPEFRKELYSNLMDAGYGKEEAQEIVGTKYYSALKIDLKNQLNKLIEDVDNNQFSQSIDTEKLNNSLSELKKMQEILS